MITLRLFHAADPFKEIDSRVLGEEEIVVGRDPAADWFVADAAAELSRRHCLIAARDGRVVLRDTSANGVYHGAERRRLPRDVDSEIEPGDSVQLGQFMIVVDTAPAAANGNASLDSIASAFDAPFHAPLLKEMIPSASELSVPTDWAQVGPTVPPRKTAAELTDADLLDAFCAGAGLDASSFAGQDPAEVMRRAGAVYKQTVLGLGDLMAERTSAKAELRLDRTTVGAAGNNPFKWAPTQRVAVDLLSGQNDNFLSGPAALKASFEDLKKHLLCLLAGSRAAMSEMLETLSPVQIEEGARSHLLLSKVESNWRCYQRRHEELTNEAHASSDGAVNLAFKRGYERCLQELDQIGTLS